MVLYLLTHWRPWFCTFFTCFYNCFTGPLEVLYRFLEFFSNFDWEKFCLSLWGPVCVNSLPDMTAEAHHSTDICREIISNYDLVLTKRTTRLWLCAHARNGSCSSYSCYLLGFPILAKLGVSCT